MAQNAAQGGGNFAGRKRARRHLIHQRLEKVIVMAVDQGNGDGRRLKSLCCVKASKTTAQDNDLVRSGHKLVCRSLRPRTESRRCVFIAMILNACTTNPRT